MNTDLASSELIAIEASYLPDHIIRRLKTHPEPITAPIVEQFEAAVLFADISGFTTLAEQLAVRGPAGAEELSVMLNDYLGRLIDIVAAHGGDIAKFAGDGLIALWSASDTPAGDLSQAVRQAAQCALTAQQRLHNYTVGDRVRMSMKLALGAGRVIAMHLGGQRDRWEFLITGDPLVQVGRDSRLAEAGDIVLSPPAWQLLQKYAVGRPLAADPPAKPAIRLLSLTQPPPPASPANHRHDLPLAIEAGLRAYIPGAILSRLDAGQFGWLAELRRVTVIFINLPELNYTMPLKQAQVVMQTLQNVLYRYEGSINKLSVDDKGIMLIAALGLPPLSHEDDATRAVLAAQDIQTELNRLNLSSAIGITTGRVFCGAVGNNLRREYTMHGDTVNLAARLMQAAPGTILCDAATGQAAKNRLIFKTLPPIQVKGKSKPVAVCQPLGQQTDTPDHQQPALVNRGPEQERLAERLAALKQGQGGVVIVSGEAGIGKSRLAAELATQAQTTGLLALQGEGNAINQSTAYYAWRPIFKQLFDESDLASAPAQRRARILRYLERHDSPLDRLKLAPLLNPVLAVDFPENSLTEQMTGKVRADNTHDLLIDILRQTATGRPVLLILENAHWLDSASWAVAARTAEQIPSLLLVIVTRPMLESSPPEYHRLLKTPAAEQIDLGRLSGPEIITLVCRLWQVTELPETLQTLLRDKTEGNPFFGEELAQALQESGLVHITHGECRLSDRFSATQTVRLPDTIQGVITNRIDRLTPSQQLTLKVASVIGRLFEFSTLHHIHPIPADKVRLPEYLTALGDLNLTALEAPPPDPAYIFKQLTTQEVTYNMLLFAQRRALHQAVADWYEQTYRDDLSPYWPLLAYHREAADQTVAAVSYLEKAGQQALHNYANEEAVEFFGRALNLAEQAEPGTFSKIQQGHWWLKLGQAYINWAKLSQARAPLERGLALLDFPPPTGLPGQLSGILKQSGQQILNRLWPQNFIGRQAANRNTLLEAAQAYEGLTAVYYFANHNLLTLYAALRSLTLAEAAGPSPELARGYASVGVIAGFIPLHRLSRLYCDKALTMVNRLDDLPAQAWVSLLAGVYYAGVGHWDKAEKWLNTVEQISQTLNDHSRWHDAVGNLAALDYFRGQPERSQQLFADMLASTRRRRDAHNQAWAWRGQVYGLLPTGDFQTALDRLTQLQTLLADHPQIVDKALDIDLFALLALTNLRLNRFEPAATAANRAADLCQETSPTSFLSLPGYAALAETWLGLWENEAVAAANINIVHWPAHLNKLSRRAKNKQQQNRLRQKSKLACDALAGYSRIFPIGRPQTNLHRANFEWLSGRPHSARKLWQQGLTAARRLQMPLVEGLLQFELGRHLPLNHPDRDRHLESAAKIFTRLEARHHLNRTEAAM